MKIASKVGILVFAFATLTLSSCGNKTTADKNTDQQATSAAVKLLTLGTPSSNAMAGVQITMHLPAGVSVKTTQSPPQTDSGVVAATGVTSGAEMIMGTYQASSSTITVYITKSSGFSPGEFATVACDLSSGGTATLFNDSVSNLSVWDTSGALITGLTASFTVSIN